MDRHKQLTEGEKSAKRQRILTFGGLGLNVAIIVGVLIWDAQLKDVEVQVKLMTHPQYLWLAAACLLGTLTLDGYIIRYACIVMKRPLNFWKALHVAVLGRYYGALIPGGFSQPLQIHAMSIENIPGGTASALILMRALWQQIILCITSLAAIIWLGGVLLHTSKLLFAAALCGLLVWLVIGIALLLMAYKSDLLVKLLKGIERLMAKLHMPRVAQRMEKWADEGMKSFAVGMDYFKLPHIHLVFAGGLVGQTLLTLLIPVFIFLAFGTPGSATVTLIGRAQLVTMVMGVVPTPGAAGGAEGSFLLLFKDYFASNVLLIAMLFWRLFTYYGYIITGAVDLMAETLRHTVFARRKV